MATVGRDVGGGLKAYYCCACDGYVGTNSFNEHLTEECIIELRTQIKELTELVEANNDVLRGAAEE